MHVCQAFDMDGYMRVTVGLPRADAAHVFDGIGKKPHILQVPGVVFEIDPSWSGHRRELLLEPIAQTYHGLESLVHVRN